MSSTEDPGPDSGAPDLREKARRELAEAETGGDLERLETLESLHESLTGELEGREDQAGTP